ncbi:hypothetical protein ACOMHN_023516 [Nucella lapillus]
MSVYSLDQLSSRSEDCDFSLERGIGTHGTVTSGPYLEGNLKLLDTIDCPEDVMCCRLSPEGVHLAVGLCDGSIKIYGASSTQLLYSLTDEDTTATRLPVTQIRFISLQNSNQQHRLLACYASGLVKFWHYTSGKCLHTVNELRQSLALAVSPEGGHFLTAGASTQIHMYDMETKQKVITMEPRSVSPTIITYHAVPFRFLVLSKVS